jgi:hypothetical protein
MLIFSRTLFYFMLVFTAPSLLFAQEGYYEYEDTENGTKSSLEVFEDGTFQYIKQGVWATSKTSGNWHLNLEGEMVLKSEFQVNDLNVGEFDNEDREGSIYMTFTAENFKRGPRKIKSIVINDFPGFRCDMDNERVLKDMEARNDLLTMGSKEDRDSAAMAYPNVYYECSAMGVDSIETIEIKFDDHQVVYVPNNPAANTFVFEMQLAPDQTYRYFNDEAFIVKRRFVTSTATGERFKKTRRP